MKGSKITHKFWARAVGLVLFAVSSAITAACVTSMAYCYKNGWHSVEAEFELEGMRAFLFLNRYNLIIVGVIAAACMLALFIFLLCSAAHKEGEEGYVLLRQDNIPLDIYLVLAVSLIFCLLLAFNAMLQLYSNVDIIPTDFTEDVIFN